MSTLALRNVAYYQTQYQKVDALKGISHRFDIGLLHAVAGQQDHAAPAGSELY